VAAPEFASVAMTKRFFSALILIFCSVAAQAQSASADGNQSATRPNAGGEPDAITMRLGVLDIAEIIDREQVFVADFFVEISWHDPRLAVDSDVAADLRTVELNEIWNPRLTIINNRGLDSLLPEVATVDRQGNVIARQRLAGRLAIDLELHDFPFDRQRLTIEVVSYLYAPSEIVFSEDSELVARLDTLSGDAWTYDALEPESYVYRLRDGGRGAAGLLFALTAERGTEYYIFTLALPMSLILFLAWMVHWLPVDIVPARTGMASATVFSLIAFGVSFRLTLPKIAYLTDADRFVLYSTLLVLVSLAITVITIRRASTGRKDAAERLARQTRRAFPFFYGLIVVLTVIT